MSTQILLPKLGFSMEDGAIAEWLVKDGAHVLQGQPLYNLEAEKSVQEIEAPASGILRIFQKPQETCSVGTVLGEIV
jgi:pyruvate/2-oxoglutarate dehydrogenase complex dihydrolipoamide acyltransferase (E2) component